MFAKAMFPISRRLYVVRVFYNRVGIPTRHKTSPPWPILAVMNFTPHGTILVHLFEISTRCQNDSCRACHERHRTSLWLDEIDRQKTMQKVQYCGNHRLRLDVQAKPNGEPPRARNPVVSLIILISKAYNLKPTRAPAAQLCMVSDTNALSFLVEPPPFVFQTYARELTVEKEIPRRKRQLRQICQHHSGYGSVRRSTVHRKESQSRIIIQTLGVT
ncbi:hypothetical protein G7K_1913-t1 [Saitoella complicata NRRL Y-17804]|uniref:Uncharacterized protein n=1 Tax=Saitoella complicata (strain BCRC 22490 / CBS 7301 / JCM 7358 / NBRC 10748 / NRRL Y-17804) TaxID=698492 RepID=A0A0E9ND00_SAICN|nr:hypothetical protein G7K_1913-t1 [Saitoella complicata NRRL Y-17804]